MNIINKNYTLLETGDVGNGECLFTTLTVNDNILDSEMLKLEQQYKPDFICKKKNGTIDFYHISNIENESGIQTNGLKFSDNNGDLGYGLYVIPKRNPEYINAIENLKDYYVDSSEDSLLLVEGTYTGEYIECIKGYKHENYIILNDYVPKENIISIKEIDIEELYEL